MKRGVPQSRKDRKHPIQQQIVDEERVPSELRGMDQLCPVSGRVKIVSGKRALTLEKTIVPARPNVPRIERICIEKKKARSMSDPYWIIRRGTRRVSLPKG
jgi:hypothetical protein